MAIALTSQTCPTSPITNRAAAQVIFDNNYAKLASLPLNQRQAIALLGMIHAAASVANYTSDHKQLKQDTQVFMGGHAGPIDVWAVLAIIGWNAGNGIDALSTNVGTLITEAKELLESSEEDLTRQFLLTLMMQVSIANA
jgi:hypothetical protein